MEESNRNTELAKTTQNVAFVLGWLQLFKYHAHLVEILRESMANVPIFETSQKLTGLKLSNILIMDPSNSREQKLGRQHQKIQKSNNHWH